MGKLELFPITEKKTVNSQTGCPAADNGTQNRRRLSPPLVIYIFGSFEKWKIQQKNQFSSTFAWGIFRNFTVKNWQDFIINGQLWRDHHFRAQCKNEPKMGPISSYTKIGIASFGQHRNYAHHNYRILRWFWHWKLIAPFNEVASGSDGSKISQASLTND